MKAHFSPAAFMIGFCGIYALAYWYNKPLFLYYPLHGNFIWGLRSSEAAAAGPGMAWYGFMADAGIAATILAVLIPDRILNKTFHDYLWLFPCVAMLVCIYLLRLFFLQG